MNSRLLVIGVAFSLLACGQAGSSTGQVPRPSPPSSSASPVLALHGVPVRLRIPKLGIDAAVEQVRTDKSGRMDVPRDYHDVAWYSPGVEPGQKGDAVIAGHLDWMVGGQLGPAVFARLASLAPGDDLEIVGGFGNTILRFSVVDSEAIGFDADPAKYGIFATDGTPRITLITCAGVFSQQIHQYQKRQIVTANLV